MNKNDIERMVSLADEKYVYEMLEDPIVLHSGKRRAFPAAAASAAAMALILGSIWHFANTAGLEEKAPTASVATDTYIPAEETEPVFNYTELFKNKYSGDLPLSFYVYSDKMQNRVSLAFDMEYALSVLPFKAEGFWDKRSQFYLYPDENGEPFGGAIYLESKFDETASPKFKCININMGKKGTLSHSFPIEDTVPVIREGIELYCYDETEAYLPDAYSSNLKAYFVMGDMEYAVETSNISAAETGEIIDSIISSGFSPDSFDTSRAYSFEHSTTQISFDRANSTEPFTGCVPVVDGILYLYGDSVIYDVQKVDGQVTGQYMAVVYTDNSGDGERIKLDYYTKGYFGKDPFENAIDLYDIDIESLDAFMTDGEYKFTAGCGGFRINVTAKCQPDKLMKYIDAIRGGSAADADQGAADPDREDQEGQNAEKEERDRRQDAEKEEQDRLAKEKEERDRQAAEKEDSEKQAAETESVDPESGVLTMEILKKLAEKGDDLTWSDFEAFDGVDIGSGIFIMSYRVEGTDYTVLVGGASLDVKPFYINLTAAGSDRHIDIRYESIDDFLKG